MNREYGRDAKPKFLCALSRNAYIHSIAVLIPARPFRNLKTTETHHHNSGLGYVIDKDLWSLGQMVPGVILECPAIV
jgi:hypothetical protein